MPYLIKTNLDAVQKEIEIWRAAHRGMKPFIIMSAETQEFITKDITINIMSLSTLKPQVLQFFGIDVATCNSLDFGEFKVR